MDKIWDRKSFEVGGHWPLWREWPRRTDKSRTIKKRKKDVQRIPIKSSVFYHIHTLFYNFTTLYAKHYQCFSLNKNNYCYYKNQFFSSTGCVCSNGWVGGNCDIDFNECDSGLDVCNTISDHNMECDNTHGSFRCQCRSGYGKLSGSNKCQGKKVSIISEVNVSAMVINTLNRTGVIWKPTLPK